MSAKGHKRANHRGPKSNFVRFGPKAEPRYFPGMTYWTDKPADFTTAAHFSVSSATSLPNSAGDIGIGVPPSSAKRAFIFGSANAAATALFSVSTTFGEIPFGPAMPYQTLAS